MLLGPFYYQAQHARRELAAEQVQFIDADESPILDVANMKMRRWVLAVAVG